MSNKEFVELCKNAVVDYLNSEADSTDKNGKITEVDLFEVWVCKTLQNHKALLSTTMKMPKQIWLPRREYPHVVSEINTWYTF